MLKVHLNDNNQEELLVESVNIFTSDTLPSDIKIIELGTNKGPRHVRIADDSNNFAQTAVDMLERSKTELIVMRTYPERFYLFLDTELEPSDNQKKFTGRIL